MSQRIRGELVARGRETPGKVLRLAAGSPPAANATAKIAYADLRRKAGPLKRPMLDVIYRQAHRETISATYTYGYGLLRPLALEYRPRLSLARMLSHRQNIGGQRLTRVRIDNG